VALFTLYGCVYFLGVGAWLLIDANKPIVAEEEAVAGTDPEREDYREPPSESSRSA
jgi:hypothetical protein